MINRLRQLLELVRFSHTLFALPFALLAAVLAWRERDSPLAWYQLAGILLAMVWARSAAMAFNRLVDRHVDARNPRTADRHLPAGQVSVAVVCWFTILCSLGFVASTAFFLLSEPPNRWPLWLSVPVLAFLLSYSYAKRLTRWCHYWLAAALMLSPLCVWIAIRGHVLVSVFEFSVPVMLAGVVFTWVGGFDIIYACQDIEVDRREGLRSVPARWGIAGALRVALVSHALTIVFLFGLWHVAELGWVFLAGVIGVSGLLVWEHRLVRPDDLSRVGLAFFQINAVISIGLFLAGLADVLLVAG